MDVEEGIRRYNGRLISMGLEKYVIDEKEKEEEKEEETIGKIKTLTEAIETLNEAGQLLNEAEDKISGEGTGLVETAYIEISDVLGYLKELDKENK